MGAGATNQHDCLPHNTQDNVATMTDDALASGHQRWIGRGGGSTSARA
jgi:hypothetical protein